MIRTLLLLTATTLLSGCFLFSRKTDTSIVLKMAVNDIYCADTACECVHEVAARTYAETQEIMASEHDITLQIDYFTDSYQLEAAVLSGKYDAVICKPWSVLRLNKEAGTDFQRIADLLDPNNNFWLTGIVIVPKGSPIQSLDELSGKHILLGKPDEYEKSYAAYNLFANHAIALGKIDMNESCRENIRELLDGNADAAVVSDYALSADFATDFADYDDFRILAHTDMIPLTSVMIDMNKFKDADERRIKSAFLSINGTNAPASLISEGFSDPWSWKPREL
ncbi:MAG: PhnD/SsuA/transferrin family substrate-binding protein [Pontiellaceae bacterium]|nr:PhnD/SsuA/transferrin family substrate-binding protein [Pontiellaceae bacterium]